MQNQTAGPSPGFAKRPGHEITFEKSPKRVRLVAGDAVLVDSRQVHLLREAGHMPVYYFPREDARMDLLERTDHSTHCPYKGEAAYWTINTRGKALENAVWSYERPYDETAEIRGFLAFYWDRMDHRSEEDEEVFGHPRDPYHRIDVRASERRVHVLLNGVTIADSTNALFLFETGLDTRYYLPREDVRTDLLVPSESKSRCPYKGLAHYWSVRVGGKTYEDVVWSYPDPLPEQPRIKNRLCFYNEKADLKVDGEPIG